MTTSAPCENLPSSAADNANEPVPPMPTVAVVCDGRSATVLAWRFPFSTTSAAVTLTAEGPKNLAPAEPTVKLPTPSALLSAFTIVTADPPASVPENVTPEPAMQLDRCPMPRHSRAPIVMAPVAISDMPAPPETVPQLVVVRSPTVLERHARRRWTRRRRRPSVRPSRRRCRCSGTRRCEFSLAIALVAWVNAIDFGNADRQRASRDRPGGLRDRAVHGCRAMSVPVPALTSALSRDPGVVGLRSLFERDEAAVRCQRGIDLDLAARSIDPVRFQSDAAVGLPSRRSAD